MEQVHLSRGDTYIYMYVWDGRFEKNGVTTTMVTVGGTKSYFSLHPSIHL